MNKKVIAIYFLALCGLPLFHHSALAEIYKDKNECILKNSSAKSIPDAVESLCNGIVYPKQSDIDFKQESQKLQEKALPLNKFLELEAKRSVEYNKIMQKKDIIRFQEQQQSSLVEDASTKKFNCTNIGNSIRSTMQKNLTQGNHLSTLKQYDIELYKYHKCNEFLPLPLPSSSTLNQ